MNERECVKEERESEGRVKERERLRERGDEERGREIS